MLLSYEYDDGIIYDVDVPEEMYYAALDEEDVQGEAALALALYIQDKKADLAIVVAEWMELAADKGNATAEGWLTEFFLSHERDIALA